jgi:hypothetical protein
VKWIFGVSDSDLTEGLKKCGGLFPSLLSRKRVRGKRDTDADTIMNYDLDLLSSDNFIGNFSNSNESRNPLCPYS